MSQDQNIAKAIELFPIVVMNINKEIDDLIQDFNLDKKISSQHVECMRIIKNFDSLTIQQLAQHQKIYKTAASKRIKKLEKLGFVKQINSDNQRVKLVKLTIEGEKTLKYSSERSAELLKERFKNYLSSEDIKNFVDQLIYIEQILKDKNRKSNKQI
ncbi:MarR family transcriptional regulator [Staphylococcus hyicus]|uniref:MarR family winged helix-turn-helix transcriptional regulator n=1 Tax=Staphylococcus hyicus TaxID=1284 RepID=UPI001F258C26|nr:MarR family transcriptional regulator [Staphylococcus hyicus]MCE5155034.1 MarR family transcriptional regulator [Staphylococcus hyicus]